MSDSINNTRLFQPAEPDKPDDVQQIMRALRQDMQEYRSAEMAAPHDPMKVLVAGMVNAHLLDETAKECAAAATGTNYKAPDAKTLKQMQNWAFKYKKKHPFAKQREVERAVARAFNVVILPDEPANRS